MDLLQIQSCQRTEAEKLVGAAFSGVLKVSPVSSFLFMATWGDCTALVVAAACLASACATLLLQYRTLSLLCILKQLKSIKESTRRVAFNPSTDGQHE